MQDDQTRSIGDAPAGSTSAGTTRRRLLRTGVNVAVGAGLVWGAGADHVSSDDTVQIVYARARQSSEGGSLEARTKPVPADWYQNVQAAFDVQRRLARTELGSIIGSFVVPGSHYQPTASLSVETAAEGVRENLEEIVGSVAVELDVNVVDDSPLSPEVSPPPGSPFEVSDVDDPRVPGGVYCRGGGTGGTLMPALYDGDDEYFATSNHVFGAKGTLKTEHAGEPLFLERGDESRRIGRVKRGYPVADVVQVIPEAGYEPISEIARASPPSVVGQYTREGLADLMARDENLHKIGATSGHTAGPIHGVDGITCYSGDVCKAGQLRWGSGETMMDGDSGSVNYHRDPENPDEHVLVGGINNARTWLPGAEFTWGTAAHQLLSEYELSF